MKWFVPVIFVLGSGIAAYGGYALARCHRSSSWPSTDGIIVDSRIESQSEGSVARLAYEYEVEGVSHRGTAIEPGSPWSGAGKHSAEALTKRYPKAAKVKVYYNPAAAADAVLEPGISRRSFTWFLFGLVWVAFGMLFWAHGNMEGEKTQTSTATGWRAKLSGVSLLSALVLFALFFWCASG